MSKASKSKRRTAAAPTPAQPPHLQVGALCWRRSSKGLRILLITSRDTGRWVIPKGWPMRRRTDADAAAREAFEEAGLRGVVSARSVGIYGYRKTMRTRLRIFCTVRVFPVHATEMLRKYPETGQRRVKWFSPERAAQRVAEPELKEIIRSFDPDTDHDPPEAAAVE